MSSLKEHLSGAIFGAADSDGAVIELRVRDVNMRVLAVLADVLSEGVLVESVAVFRRVRAGAARCAAPVLRVLVDDGGCLDVRLHGELGVKSRSLRVEDLLGQDTLRELHVGARERLGLPILKGAIGVVEALRARASRGRQIRVVLELPVGPADKVLVSNVAHLSDLLSAGAF